MFNEGRSMHDPLYGMDKDIIVEINKGNPNQREHLLDYYLKLQLENGTDIPEKRKEVLRRIAFSMTEDDAKEQCARIDEATKKRLLAYHDALSCLYQQNTDELQEIKNTVNELVEAYEDHDFDREAIIEINGNYFTYDSEKIDIEKYRTSLADLGDESKGNSWRVEVSETGEVVLHW